MSETDYKKIFQLSPSPCFVIQDGFFKLANPAMAELAGYSPGEILDMPFDEVMRREGQGQCCAEIQASLQAETGYCDQELKLVGRSGRAVDLLVRFSPFEISGRGAVLGQVINTKEDFSGWACRVCDSGVLKRVDYLVSMIDNLNEAFIIYDVSARITFVNKKACSLLGYGKKDVLGKSLIDYIAGEYRETARQEIIIRLVGGEQGSYEIPVFHKNGEMRLLSIRFSPIVDSGKITGGVMVGEDITEQKIMEEALKESEANYRAIFDSVNDAIFIHDMETGRVLDVNRKMCEMYGYTREEAVYLNVDDTSMGQKPFSRPEAYEYVRKAAGGEPQIFEWMAKDRSGRLFWVEVNLKKAVIGGKDCLLAAVRDISARKKAEERLNYLSLHDYLTGLYNRAYFEEEMARLGKGRSRRTGVIVCDLDGLRLINDTLGHDCGNDCLLTAAGVIKRCFREGDMVARIGGDEFAVLIPDCDRKTVEGACRRIRESIEEHNRNNWDRPLSISIGFACSDRQLSGPGAVFKEAENNMCREKLHRSRSARSAVVQILLKALEARDFITEGHGQRLQDLVSRLAFSCGVPAGKTNDLRLLAQFHDIGKVGIPDSILFKPGPLTAAEAAEMKRHCEIGCRIAKSAPDLAPLSEWILKHHEWWNGGGYPLGLKGAKIPLECRILAIADAYDAMTSDRPYRGAMSVEQALAELRRCAGTQFDPHLVEVFISLIVP